MNEIDILIVDSMKSESLTDLISGVADTALDSIIDSGSLDGVPIVGLITGSIRGLYDIRDRIFLRKVLIFLKELSSASCEKRVQFVSQFSSDEKKQEFGQTILLLLERADDMKKPKMVAKIFSACISGHVSLEKAVRLATIIDRSYVKDLNHLKNFVDGAQSKNQLTAEHLFSIGLLTSGGFDSGSVSGDDGGTIYLINEYGEMLVKYCLD